MDARRDPIKKKFHYIQEQDQDIGGVGEMSEEDKAKLDGLDDAWLKFQDGLDEASHIIQKCYAQLKTEVDSQIDDFKKDCLENKKHFQQQAPYSVDKNMDNDKAFEKLQEFKGYTQQLRANEEEMKFGLDIFEIEQMAYPEVNLVEKEIGLLTEVWEVKNEWDKQWDQWKDIRFGDLDCENMLYDAQDFFDKCIEFDKDVREWGIYSHLKSEI